jgi:hypothetical protein
MGKAMFLSELKLNEAHRWDGEMPMHGPVAYCCSRFRAADELEAGWNRSVAVALTRYVALHGWAPITPHLYLPLVLDDDDEKERGIGLGCGLRLVRRSDVVFCYSGDDVSEGMAAELALAADLALSIFFIDAPAELGLCLSAVDSGLACGERAALTREVADSGEGAAEVPCGSCRDMLSPCEQYWTPRGTIYCESCYDADVSARMARCGA